MCNKGGSPPIPNQTSTAYQSATAPSPFVQPYYQAFLQNASQLQGTPFNPAMQGTVAPFNDYQVTAGNALFGQGLSGAGGFPAVTNAANAVTGAAAPVAGAANALQAYGGTMGTFDPTLLNQVMSPFTENVVGATQNWFNNQNAIQSNDLLSQAIRSGNAFGGDRAGVAQAQLAGQQQLAQAPVIAGLRQAGYTQALDEYNQLRQMGLGGLQAGLGGQQAAQQAQAAGLGAQVTAAQAPSIAQQQLMTALGFGQQVQQQQQRGLDVAQQNAMMASAYPFQVQNWYGSTLGGLGPLLGSFAQGYTTPPQPNELTQGLGIATGLASLGKTLFGGKRGGPVGRRLRGGLVPVLARGGGLGRDRAPPGTLGRRLPPRRFQAGGDSGDDQMDTGATNINVTGGMPFRSRFSGIAPMSSMSAMNIPQFKAPTDAQDFMDKMRRQTKQGQQTNPNDPATLIKNLGTAAKGAAGLFALLERGGDVKRFAAGGDDDDDDDDDDTDQTVGGGPAQAPQPVASLQPGQLFTPGALEPGPSAGPSPGQTAAVQGFLGGTDTEGQAPTPAGYRGGYGGGGTQVIPGLAPPPKSFFQRWTSDPLFHASAAMLMSRSPYFGEGLGAGMAAAAGAAQQQRKEDLLDNKPVMIDDGKSIKVRHGNKITDTGLPSRRGQAQIQKREMALEKLDRAGRQGKAGRDYTDQTLNAMIKQEFDSAKLSGKPISPAEAEYNATVRFNARHPDLARPLPAKPESTPDTRRYPVEDPREWWEKYTPFGRSDPNAGLTAVERARPARPAPAAPAPIEPAQPKPPATQQAQPPAQQQQPVDRLRDALATNREAATKKAIADAQATIRLNPAAEPEIRRRLKVHGIELP
jgi:hypothetical protein